MELISECKRKNRPHIASMLLVLLLCQATPVAALMLSEADACSMESCKVQGFCCCKLRFAHASGEHKDGSIKISIGLTVRNQPQCAMLPVASISAMKQKYLATTYYWAFSGLYPPPSQSPELSVSSVDILPSSSRAPPFIKTPYSLIS
jgi:hypothetical protein